MALGAWSAQAADLHGTPKDDDITGTARHDYIAAGAGDDTVVARGGADEVDAGAGDDTVSMGAGTRVASQPGMVEYDSAYGGAGNDVLRGGRDRDFLLDGEGDDRLYRGLGDDLLEVTPGHGLGVGGRGRDQVYLGHPEDDSGHVAITTVRAGTGRDAIVTLDDGQPDELDCGGDRDVVHYFGDRDPLDTLVGCEVVKENSEGRWLM